MRIEYRLTLYAGTGNGWLDHRIAPVREAIRRRGVILDSYPALEEGTEVRLHEFRVAAEPEAMAGILVNLTNVLGESSDGPAPRLRWWRLRDTRFCWRPTLERQSNGCLDVSFLWWTWYNEPETQEERDA